MNVHCHVSMLHLVCGHEPESDLLDPMTEKAPLTYCAGSETPSYSSPTSKGPISQRPSPADGPALVRPHSSLGCARVRTAPDQFLPILCSEGSRHRNSPFASLPQDNSCACKV